MADYIYENLVSFLTADNVLINEPMKNHCTFKTGGASKYFVMPQNAEQVCQLVKFANSNSIEYFVLGNGSNLVVSDTGYDGIIVYMGKNMSDIKVNGNTITAMAGVTLAKLSSVACQNELSGLEFASGIPATVGGAAYMNAGAYGGEIKDVLRRTTYIDTKGKIKQIEGDEHQFGYRTSVFKQGGIVIECEFCLENGDKQQILQKMTDFNNRRREKQPLEYPSAGSTFKRPEGYFAGKLIEDAGLGGYTIGGAKVSKKHKGFIINKNNATTKDIIALICYVQKTVYEKFGVLLEPEVKYLGDGFTTYKP